MLFSLIAISALLAISSGINPGRLAVPTIPDSLRNHPMFENIKDQICGDRRSLVEGEDDAVPPPDTDNSEKVKQAVELAISHALAEALILKAAKTKLEGQYNVTWHDDQPKPSKPETTASQHDETSIHHHLNDDELRALAKKWADRFADLKKAHDAKKKALELLESEHNTPKTTEGIKLTAETTQSVESEGPVVLLKDFPDISESPSDQLIEEVANDNDALNGDDGDDDVNNKVDTRHIVVNFSTESLMNLWAIVGMILIINVILYCCYTRRKSGGRAYLARSGLSPDDV